MAGGTQINRYEPPYSSGSTREALDRECHSDNYSHYSTASWGQREVCSRPGGCTEEVTMNLTFCLYAYVPWSSPLLWLEAALFVLANTAPSLQSAPLFCTSPPTPPLPSENGRMWFLSPEWCLQGLALMVDLRFAVFMSPRCPSPSQAVRVFLPLFSTSHEVLGERLSHVYTSMCSVCGPSSCPLF